MKRLIVFLSVILLSGIGVGFARGWFAVSQLPDSGDNKVDIKVTVDPEKMKSDSKTVGEKVKDLPTRLKNSIETPSDHSDGGVSGSR